MRFRLLCAGVVRQFLRRPVSFLSLYVLWFLLRLIAPGGGGGGREALLTATDSAALTGCLSALSLQSAQMLLQDRENSVLYHLKAAGAGHPLLFSAFHAAMLLAGAAAAFVFCLFLFAMGMPFRWTVLLLPVAAALPSLFYSSLGMLCGGLSRNGIWFLCVFLLTVTAAMGSGLFLDWEGLAPDVYSAVRFLPVNVYARFFRAVFSLDSAAAEPARALIPAGYTLAALACAFLGAGRRYKTLKQKDL